MAHPITAGMRTATAVVMAWGPAAAGGSLLAVFQNGAADPFGAGTYLGTADTMLLSDNGTHADENFGARTDFAIGRTGALDDRAALIRFDVSGIVGQYSEIHAMRLVLTVKDGNTAGVDAPFATASVWSIGEADADWVEGDSDGAPELGASSYNSRRTNAAMWSLSAGPGFATPAAQGSAAGSFAYDVGDLVFPGTIISIPLTDPQGLIEDWTDGTNNGLVIRLNELLIGSDLVLHSSEAELQALRPLLAIEYTAVPVPGTVCVVISAGLISLRRSRPR